ncbi:MAG: PadR family transcriptional regulator [Myxococcota bacterium]
MRHTHHRHRARRGMGRRHGFGMWGWGSRFFGPGELRLALLSLLSEGPRHGYELMKQLEARSGGMYRASAGSVYPTLQQLEDEGLVGSERVNGKRVYQLSAEGERAVEDDAEAARRIWRRADEWGDCGPAAVPEAWEIARPATQLAKAALRAMARGEHDPDRVERIREILDRARSELEALAHAR